MPRCFTERPPRYETAPASLPNDAASGSLAHELHAIGGKQCRNSRTDSDFACDGKCAAMQLDEVFGQRQTEPGARVFSAQTAVNLAEASERYGNLFRCHADAGVLHRNGNTVVVPQNRNVDASTAWREFHGIRNQIQQYLPDAAIVGAKDRQSVG